MNDPYIRTSAAKLAWTTPRLDQLGTMDDVHSGGSQGELDGDFQPDTLAS